MRKVRLSYSVGWLLLSLVIAVLAPNSSFTIHSILVLLTFTTYCLCGYNWIKNGCRAASIFMFFLVYSFLCNCGQSFLFVFNVPVDYLNTYTLQTIEEVSYSLRFQLVGMAALNVGVCLGTSKQEYCTSMKEQQHWYKQYDSTLTKSDKYLFALMVLMLLGTVYAALEMAKIRASMSYYEFLSEGYMDVNNRFYFTYFFSFLSIRAIFKKQHVLFVYGSWLFFIGLYMYYGLRAQAIPYITFFIIALPITHGFLLKKKLIVLWAIAAFFAIIGLGIIGATRYEDKVDLSTVDRSQGVQIAFYSAMTDVGSPGKTLGMTMKLCDNGVPHFQTILYSFATVVPYRVLKVPTSVFEKIPNYKVLASPANYMADKAGLPGFGFSFFSEAYLNYGWLGWIYILLLGYAFARLENNAYQDIMYKENFFKIAFLLYLAKLVFYARGNICLAEGYLEYMVFLAIIYKLFQPKMKLL